jgi:phosphate:Na+ symporter
VQQVILSVLAGLVLFLYAVHHLSETIQKVLGERARQWILRFTGKSWQALLTGIIVTTLLDSSSAVIIITIVFVNAGAMSFRNAMGVVLGANIGTTVSSQLIALDIASYSPILLALGFVLLLASRSERVGNTGRIIMFFGILFFGLFTMEEAVEPLRAYPEFQQMLDRTKDPLTGALTGAFITLIIQSSSATVGMAIILTKKGILSLGGAIAVMLGAELGTCSDTLLATIKGTRQALKTGLFHLIFNLCSILLGLILFQPFTDLVLRTGNPAHPEHLVANAHMLFNTCGVLLFWGSIPIFERVLNKILPDKPLAVVATGDM